MGRPRTGRNSKVVRVPLDFDVEKAVTFYYDWYPIIQQYRQNLTTSPRDYKLAKLLGELEP